MKRMLVKVVGFVAVFALAMSLFASTKAAAQGAPNECTINAVVLVGEPASCNFSCWSDPELPTRITVTVTGTNMSIFGDCGGVKPFCTTGLGGIFPCPASSIALFRQSYPANAPTGNCRVKHGGNGLALAGPAIGSCKATILPQPGAVDDAHGRLGCTFAATGRTGDAGENGINSLTSDVLAGGGWDLSQLLDSDPGQFSFEGDAICAGVDIASEHKNSTQPQGFGGPAYSISATGIYDNLVCGTATLSGVLTIVGSGVQVKAKFGMTVAVGVGSMSLTVADGSQIGESNVDAGAGTGAVDIFRDLNDSTGGNCVNQNVTALLVNGAFELSFSGEGSTSSFSSDSDA